MAELNSTNCSFKSWDVYDSKDIYFTVISSKVEKILKGSLDLIPSPSTSVKIQIMDRKVCLRCKGKTFENTNFVDITQQCIALLPQVNFPGNNLNFY